MHTASRFRRINGNILAGMVVIGVLCALGIAIYNDITNRRAQNAATEQARWDVLARWPIASHMCIEPNGTTHEMQTREDKQQLLAFEQALVTNDGKKITTYIPMDGWQCRMEWRKS